MKHKYSNGFQVLLYEKNWSKTRGWHRGLDQIQYLQGDYRAVDHDTPAIAEMQVNASEAQF